MHLLLCLAAAASAFRAPGRPRSSARVGAKLQREDHLALPEADLILVDGDNVRGKTAFRLSAKSLEQQMETFSETRDCVLYRRPSGDLARRSWLCYALQEDAGRLFNAAKIIEDGRNGGAERKPVWADSCAVGPRAPPSFERSKSAPPSL